MNKGLLIGLIALGVLVLGVAGFFVMNNKSSPTTTPSSTSEVTAQPEAEQPQSLRALMQMGNNQTCTFSDTQSQSEGTVYVSNENVRGDFTARVNNAESMSHMILSGDTMYMWTEGEKTGFQMSMADLESAESAATKDVNTSERVDLDRQIDYECESWRVDNSVFTVPSDVEFTDYSALMQDAQAMMEDTDVPKITDEDSADQCATCANLPAGAKEQCLQSLSCN